MYPFEYQRPTQRAEALAACDDEARFLAGGQSLVQAMKLRLAAPQRLIDLAAVPGLSGVRVEGSSLVIGAMTRHGEVAVHPEVCHRLPALAELASGIGDPMVRQMGTLGGSIANADPAACYPAAVLALDAVVRTDRREIAASAFFTGIYETALAPGELITEVRFPLPTRAAYMKFKQPASRFAWVGVFVSQSDAGVRVAVTGARASVYREPALERALSVHFTPESARAVVLSAEGLQEDLHGSAAYRAAMISVMTARAVERALSR